MSLWFLSIPRAVKKTTLLRMIAGLEEISSGDIFIDGVRVNDVASRDRDIAMVFQNYALYPHMMVYENMAFGLKPRGFSRVEINQRVHEAANILGIEHMGNEIYLYFSIGTDGNVLIARLTPGLLPSAGQPIELVFDMEYAHFFDQQTENVI